MGPASQQRSLSPLEAQIRECFGRVAYSHKTHEKSADIELSRLTATKWAQLVLSAVATTGLLVTILGPTALSRSAAIASCAVSTLLVIVNAYAKSTNNGQQAERHSCTATLLWRVREQYVSLLTDLADRTISEADARLVRDRLESELAGIYADAPRTSAKAYARAQEALQVKEDLTFSTVEIDRLLPPPLRAANPQSP